MRLRFLELPEHRRPQSGTLSFAGAWAASAGSRAQVETAIARWRRHGRTSGKPAAPGRTAVRKG
jgi:hypothetical protein